MLAKVILSVTSGSLKGLEFEFSDRITIMIGRAKDCYIRLPDDDAHSNISRYHCLLDINPPLIWIRDLGSKNGTYINGKKIGQRRPNQIFEHSIEMNLPEHNLSEGDEIALGKLIFRVRIEITNYNWANLAEFAARSDPNLPNLEGYTLIRELGREENSVVYVAHNNLTGDLVTLKIELP